MYTYIIYTHTQEYRGCAGSKRSPAKRTRKKDGEGMKRADRRKAGT
jgi:hypothetical protein